MRLIVIEFNKEGEHAPEVAGIVPISADRSAFGQGISVKKAWRAERGGCRQRVLVAGGVKEEAYSLGRRGAGAKWD